ncbi:MAG: ribonuclease P protein component [Firmicutes bacterium]|uniref:Ribonuclease P protein component n=1 Tax=Candidatus Colimorpha enterica TaxID=3083063 RepID=R6T8I3_9BACT|nr:ribonuclease P protein component [Candidatus Colimorpha enterica]MCI5754889.1 ribonuclease P protein component [Candidatus Colimorpha enterica]MDD6321244.1 ribonuclease P protein component [Bacillota bacterium]MDY2906467.1 ribonuclease P protein component [Eubacteriales bacterium]CDC69738.1 ribonuclease P protein component [Candidatus Colimorpha enterica]
MKEFAIKENHLFVKAYTKGMRFSGKTVTVYVLRDYKAAKLKKENPQKKYLNRIGFTATTKLGNAVTRNRCKRIMRAAYRGILSERSLRTGNLIVISARGQAVGATSEEVKRDLVAAFGKLGLFV